MNLLLPPPPNRRKILGTELWKARMRPLDPRPAEATPPVKGKASDRDAPAVAEDDAVALARKHPATIAERTGAAIAAAAAAVPEDAPGGDDTKIVRAGATRMSGPPPQNPRWHLRVRT